MGSSANDCDTCTEQAKGYDRAIEVLEKRIRHLEKLGGFWLTIRATHEAIEELRKERA